jgi:formylglycine-generating enzyme required for sulfatase activity
MALALAFLAAPMATYAADEMRIESLDATGRMTFTRIPTGQAYRVECATSLTGAWTRVTNAVTIDGIPTTMDCIPAKAGGLVTGAVPVEASAMFFRTVTETNDMVFITAGEFVMGATTNMGHEGNPAETPQHTVYLSAFYIDRYKVTMERWNDVRQWATNHGYADLAVILTGTTGLVNAANAKGATHPVIGLHWYDAVKWCNARSEMESLVPCYTDKVGGVYRTGATGGSSTAGTNFGGCNWQANGYRLPTEAEWEKAARGGVSGRRFPWSDSDTIQHTRANYNARPGSYVYDTSATSGFHPAYTNGELPYTSPVGSFAPNGYGLYDLMGNANEWCWDWYSDTYYGASPRIDPRGPDTPPLTDKRRVVRGGYYNNFAWSLRVAYRWADQPYGWANLACDLRPVRPFMNGATNHAPVIAEGASVNRTISEDGAPTPFDLTLHATDADGDSIGWWVLTPPSHGSATVRGQGTGMPIVYQPATNYYGSDNFTVQAYDPWGATTSILVNVTIQAVNDPPVANAQGVSVAANTPRAITLTGSDVEGSGLTYAVDAPPAHGSLSGAAPNVTYTPDPGFKGPDSFTFKVNDGTTDGVPATVTLWVNSMAAAGGSLTNYTANGTNYTAHIFTTVGNSTLAVSAGGAVEVLVVAGGGGGGGYSGAGGGGGGAGGLIYTNLVLAAGNQPVTVGAGGLGGGFYVDTATKGSNSVLGSLTALGGGCGKVNTNGTAGGSGAGGYGNGAAGGAANQPGGYANAGGMGGEKPGGGGGGGGAGSAGGAGVTNSVGGVGGAGLSYDISGILRSYAGGGGGGAQVGSGGAATDGGGSGGSPGVLTSTGVAGLPNTGGGGGGGATGGGAGGSGIVIVRYGIAVP